MPAGGSRGRACRSGGGAMLSSAMGLVSAFREAPRPATRRRQRSGRVRVTAVPPPRWGGWIRAGLASTGCARPLRRTRSPRGYIPAPPLGACGGGSLLARPSGVCGGRTLLARPSGACGSGSSGATFGVCGSRTLAAPASGDCGGRTSSSDGLPGRGGLPSVPWPNRSGRMSVSSSTRSLGGSTPGGAKVVGSTAVARVEATADAGRIMTLADLSA
jgi:hypothetical protein